MTDLELLRQYIAEGKEDAFAVLVGRYLALVYSAARRQVRSPPWAEEIAQSVFTDLARQAARLKPDTILSAWLYRVTRRTALDFMRRESRRQKREQIGLEMAAMNASSPDWAQIEPVLDEAMERLDETERSAILVRYFEQKNLREVGQVLGISEDAAQKRVSRAVERLRAFFVKRGLAVSAGSLAMLLSAHAVEAVPASLAVTLAGASISAAAGATQSSLLTDLVLMAKTKLVITSVVLVAAVGPALFLQHQQRNVRQENARLSQRQSELTVLNASLQNQLNRLTAQTTTSEESNRLLRARLARFESPNRAPDGQGRFGPATSGVSNLAEAETNVIRLRKENLHQIRFEAINDNLELTETTKDLLQLKPEETAQLSAALQELKQRIQTHDLAVARQVPVEEIKDEDIVQFLKRNPGQSTTFRIPALSAPEQKSLHEWFAQGLDQVLGSERSQSLANNARVPLDFWFGGTEDKILAFVDKPNADNGPVCSWMVKFNTPSSHGTYSGDLNHQSVPPQFAYLFDIHPPQAKEQAGGR